ncbi:uncharacterized protein EV420DRAFT_1647075 [Desarmillaria tabescens]|uniref:Uncharacterized protein n=1 Tax=Armillaria tabescens TaxID=1929756 RepID=A0AA39JUA3_ARMTA|nr:uncharacterized protein EV420DRAFT_1647075 [Desarmillaria tabescens]KAK0449046.1 hypothetical protein EV420DRAFT_1647075 [Desarmillaria tabescens]
MSSGDVFNASFLFTTISVAFQPIRHLPRRPTPESYIIAGCSLRMWPLTGKLTRSPAIRCYRLKLPRKVDICASFRHPQQEYAFGNFVWVAGYLVTSQNVSSRSMLSSRHLGVVTVALVITPASFHFAVYFGTSILTP